MVENCREKEEEVTFSVYGLGKKRVLLMNYVERNYKVYERLLGSGSKEYTYDRGRGSVRWGEGAETRVCEYFL